MSDTTFNRSLLEEVLTGFNKKSFVPMPGGQSEPVAGASMATAAMGQPMGGPPGAMPPGGGGGMPPGAQGGDPNAAPPVDPVTGFPIDPNTGMPVDPSTGLPVDPGMVAQQQGVDPQTGEPLPPEEGAPAEGAPAEEPGEVSKMSRDEMKAMVSDIIRAELPGIIQQELQPILNLVETISGKEAKEPAPAGEPGVHVQPGDTNEMSAEILQELKAMNTNFASLLGQ